MIYKYHHPEIIYISIHWSKNLESLLYVFYKCTNPIIFEDSKLSIYNKPIVFIWINIIRINFKKFLIINIWLEIWIYVIYIF